MTLLISDHVDGKVTETLKHFTFWYSSLYSAQKIHFSHSLRCVIEVPSFCDLSQALQAVLEKNRARIHLVLDQTCITQKEGRAEPHVGMSCHMVDVPMHRVGECVLKLKQRFAALQRTLEQERRAVHQMKNLWNRYKPTHDSG